MNKIDKSLFIYSFFITVKTVLKKKLNDQAEIFTKKVSKDFDELSSDEKIYYSKYATNVVESLLPYFDFKSVEYNDVETEIKYDVQLLNGNKKVVNIFFCHKINGVNNIIPSKLMKKCKYIKSTNVNKQYTALYTKINDNAYDKFKNIEKFADLTKQDKDKHILTPVTDLIVETLKHKKKCAQSLYSSIFSENEKIIVKLYKNRFTIFDFYGADHEIESFKISKQQDNTIDIIFNNGAHFIGNVETNSVEIKEKLSLRLNIKFKNMDDIYKLPNINS